VRELRNLVEAAVVLGELPPPGAGSPKPRDDLLGARRESILQTIPLARAATADEIAGSVVFLASELATFITGEVLNVNGGAVLVG